MRSRLFVLVALALFVFPSAAALGADSNPFQGSWVGTDVWDGSRNMLTVGGGNNHVVYQESGITGCLDYEPFGQFVGGSVAGFATIEGNTLTFTGTLYCHLEEGRTIHPSFENVDWVFDYNPITGGLTLATDANTTLTRPSLPPRGRSG